MARGGDVLAPGDPAAQVQFIDARDAAGWLLRQAGSGRSGVFNLTGPVRERIDPLTMGGFLDTAARVLNPGARLNWADEAFLLAHGVRPWSELPMWVPRESAGLHAVDIRRAVAAGLVCRPLAETLTDTAAWAALTPPAAAGAGLAADREAALLAAWRQQAAADPDALVGST